MEQETSKERKICPKTEKLESSRLLWFGVLNDNNKADPEPQKEEDSGLGDLFRPKNRQKFHILKFNQKVKISQIRIINQSVRLSRSCMLKPTPKNSINSLKIYLKK